jgi:acyl carrier protein
LVCRLPVLGEIGETMDPRAPPQLDFDANDVRTLIARYLGIDAELVTDEVHFSNDFDLDSLGRLELLILIEEEFLGFEFSDTTRIRSKSSAISSGTSRSRIKH